MKKLFAEESFEVWCLLAVSETGTQPLFYGSSEGDEPRFWLGGSLVALAAYESHQSAYSMKKKAAEDLKRLVKDIVVRKAIVFPGK